MKKRGRPRKTPVAEDQILDRPSKEDATAAFGFAAPPQNNLRIVDDEEPPRSVSKKASKQATLQKQRS